MAATGTSTTSKRQGSGKANWGRPGDELLDVPIDHMDPSYDSAEELMERAFGKYAKCSNFDWAAFADLSDEDHMAMNEIEDEIRHEWLEKHSAEQAEIEDEGEAFFFEVKTFLCLPVVTDVSKLPFF